MDPGIYLPEIPESHMQPIAEDCETMKKLLELLNKLLPCVRESETSQNLLQNLRDLDKLCLPELESNIKQYEASMRCKKCKKTFMNLIVLSTCGHGFCRECIYQYLNHITNKVMIFNDFEGGSQKCPICQSPITKKDLKTILEDQYKTKKLESQVRNINKQISQNSSFFCINCEKLRSPQMKPTDCMHMCKICVSENFRNKSSKCKVCRAEQEDGKKGIPEKMVCGKCRDEMYFVGDFMLEICENCVFCYECLRKIIDSKMCNCGRVLEGRETIEIYEFLYGVCKDCGKEDLKKNIRNKICCGAEQ